MQVIRNNPFRTIGVLANTSEKELQKQKSRITAFLNVGKELAFDADFPILGPISRNPTLVEDAFAKVERNENKVRYGLFWFTDGMSSDELALNHLRAGNAEKAIEIWTKIAEAGTVTKRTYSAINNLGTLKLALALKKGVLEQPQLIEGLGHKLTFLESDGLSHFIDEVADPTAKKADQTHIHFFLQQVLSELDSYIEKNPTVILSDLKRLFSTAGIGIKSQFESIFSEKPLHRIETRIEEVKAHRKSDARSCKHHGEDLVLKGRKDLKSVHSVLGSRNATFQHTADKLANEVLQCGVDYFSALRESTAVDPSSDVLQLFQSAESIAVGTLTKERIKENLQGLQEWIDSRPEREKRKQIEQEFDFIYDAVEKFQQLRPSVENVRNLLSACKPKLDVVGRVLTTKDDLYITMSSAVAGNAQGMLVAVFNAAQESALAAPSPQSLQTFQGIILRVVEVLRVLGSFAMSPDLRESYEKNWYTIHDVKRQVDSIAQQNDASWTVCYIATMAYGDPGHPKVILLRNWRDERLMHFNVGRLFVRAYNRYSPNIVRLLRNKHRINAALRFGLDQFARILEKR